MSDLIIGWQVTPNLEPRYWLGKNTKAGAQPETDLFTISSGGLGSHTAIIAQSGSGKSFFLGRLIEEIGLRTKARCLILDPNADFRKLHEVEDEQLWAGATYDLGLRAGKLTHEPGREAFASSWSNVSIVVHVGTTPDSQPYEQIRLSWPAVSTDFLGEDLGPVQRSELYHCHSFVKNVHALLAVKVGAEKRIDYLLKAESLLGQAMANPSDFTRTMREEFGSEIVQGMPSEDVFIPGLDLTEITKSSIRRFRDQRLGQAAAAARYVSEDVRRFYFGRVNEFRSAQIIENFVGKGATTKGRNPRIEVVDLPSLPSPATRLLAMNAIIATEWDRARTAWSAALTKPVTADKRVPTFLIVDEAHNVVPFETRSKAEHALREQFRTIVAEGRKYGLFLILVSQRPEKLDPLVVSECENRAVMKLSSASALESTRRMLSLEDVPANVLSKCLDMPIGRVLISGPWSPHGPDFLYSAARRTVEGGRNLRASYWGMEPSQAPAPKDVE